MVAPILILAIGNESRGDDALAPLLLRQLEEGTNPQQVELLEDFQLQIEHAADLVDRKLVLFIDAGTDTPAPYAFYRAQLDEGRMLFSHALMPEAVLATYAQVYRQAPPPAYVLCVRGEQFELGAPLSKEAQARMELARRFMQTLLRDAGLAAWETHCLSGTMDQGSAEQA
jgi:hydrogenase maturation protease